MTVAKLLEPFRDDQLTRSGKGMTAVDHTAVVERLLSDVGPYAFALVEILREQMPELVKKSTYPGGLMVTGAIATLTVEVDGRTVTITEAGGVENAQMIDGDGERVKHALSDAIKRCAMRLGLGLHVWAQRDVRPPLPSTGDALEAAGGDVERVKGYMAAEHEGARWGDLSASQRHTAIAALRCVA